MRIRYLFISETIENKLWNKHGLTHEEVYDLIISQQPELLWQKHPRHGSRYLGVIKNLEGEDVRIILRPIDKENGIWKLITAFREDNER